MKYELNQSLILTAIFADQRIPALELAENLGVSDRDFRRSCTLLFGRSFKKLQGLILWAHILELVSTKKTPQEIADIYFFGDLSFLYHFIRRYDNHPLKKIVMRGKNAMTLLELQALRLLSQTSGFITKSQLGVTAKVIRSLREQKFVILSKPGCGYQLSSRSKATVVERQQCEKWINNVRTKRYALPPNFTV